MMLEKSCEWKDYQSSILQSVRDFHTNDQFTDMITCCDHISISAHRLVYAAFGVFPSEEVLKKCPTSSLCIYKSVPKSYLNDLVTLIYEGSLNLTDPSKNSTELLGFLQNNLRTRGIVQNYVYRLEDYEKVLLSFLKEQFNKPRFSDITLICDGKVIHGHRLILASMSPFFKDLFLRCQEHPVIILEGVSHEDLHAVLQFCYSGAVESKVKNASSKLINAALFLQIKSFDHFKSKRAQTNKVQAKKSLIDCNMLKEERLPPKVFLDLFNKEELVDTVLVCTDGSLKAHSVVLCVLPYFYELFRKVEITIKRGLREIVVLLNKVSVNEVRCLVHYLYTGRLRESVECWTKNQVLVKLYTYPNYLGRQVDEAVTKPVKKRKNKILVESKLEDTVEDTDVSKNLEDKSISPRRSPTPDAELLSSKGEPEPQENNQPPVKSSENPQLKPHECSVCKDVFQSGRAWKQHLKIHPEGGRLKCLYCNKTYRKRFDLQVHMRSHTGVQPYSCDVCGKSYSLRSSLAKHKDSHTANKQNICETCGKMFKRQEYLTEHMRTHSGEKPYSCDVCGKGFVGRTGLNHHKQSHVDKSSKLLFVCEICGKSYTKHSLWTHMQSHTRSFQCFICHKKFVNKTSLDKHVRGQHYKETTEKCEQCGHGFMSKSHLKRHLLLHQQKNIWSCTECNVSFTNESKYTNHMSLKHGPPGTKPYKCDICHKQFMKKNGLIYHRRVHTGEKPCRCSTCHKSFMRPDKLRLHEWTHTEKRPYQCSVCSKQWVCKSALNKHMLTHENQGGDKYAVHCETCGKGFPTEGHLETHSRIHINPPIKQPETAFLCSICHQIYKDEASLKNHVQLHNYRKLIVCTSCGLSFVEHKLFLDHASVSHDKNADFYLKCGLCNGTFKDDELLESHTRDQHGYLLDGTTIPSGHNLENVSIIIPVFEAVPVDLHIQGATGDGQAAPIMSIAATSGDPIEPSSGATYMPFSLTGGGASTTVLPVQSGTVLPVSIGNTNALISVAVSDSASLMPAPDTSTIFSETNNSMCSIKNAVTITAPPITVLPDANPATESKSKTMEIVEDNPTISSSDNVGMAEGSHSPKNNTLSGEIDNSETTEHAETLLTIRNATYRAS